MTKFCVKLVDMNQTSVSIEIGSVPKFSGQRLYISLLTILKARLKSVLKLAAEILSSRIQTRVQDVYTNHPCMYAGSQMYCGLFRMNGAPQAKRNFSLIFLSINNYSIFEGLCYELRMLGNN